MIAVGEADGGNLMTEAWWTHWWFWWLLAVFLTWLAMELTSIVVAHVSGQRNIADYTLSDTIRRWSAKRRWLAPLVIGAFAGLAWHFFGQVNA